MLFFLLPTGILRRTDSRSLPTDYKDEVREMLHAQAGRPNRRLVAWYAHGTQVVGAITIHNKDDKVECR